MCTYYGHRNYFCNLSEFQENLKMLLWHQRNLPNANKITQINSWGQQQRREFPAEDAHV